jgi:hypothetical protein
MGLREALWLAAHRRLLVGTGLLREALGKPVDRTAAREFELMREDNLRAHPVYQAGHFWAQINRDFRTLIWAGALENLRDEYFNRRFSDPGPTSFQIYAALMNIYYNRLRETAPAVVDALEDPDLHRSSSVVSLSGKAVSLDLLQSAEEIAAVQEALRLAQLPSPEIIVEIGAGYGRLAYACRIFDLPEALVCAQTWLSRASEQTVIPYSQAREVPRLDRAVLGGRPGIWLLGPQHIERVADDSADLFVNTYSLAEMPGAAVDNYYRELSRIVRGVFYSKQRQEEVNHSDATVNEVGSYPELPGAELLFRRNAMLYAGITEEAYSLRRAALARAG